MRKVIIDFNIIKTYKELNIFLEKTFNLSKWMTGNYWYNLAAFWDMYWYRDDNDFFEIRGYDNITDKFMKEQVDWFISYLNDLKWFEGIWGRSIPNPNFDYKIVS